MRTVYTVNTCNKFAALSLSDDDEDQPVIIKQEAEKINKNLKDNPSSLIYPKEDEVPISNNSNILINNKADRGSRKGNTIHRGGRGGYSSNHGRIFDRRDASGKGHRTLKHNSLEINEENWNKDKNDQKNTVEENSAETDTDNVNNNKLDENKQGSKNKDHIISYEEYMRTLAPKRVEVPRVEVVKVNTTQKDLEKEGLKRYIRDDNGNCSNKNNKDRSPKINVRNDKDTYNYFEFIEKYGSRGSFNRRNGDSNRKNKNYQRNSFKVQGKREAPDVTDTRVFPVLGQ